MGAFVVGQSHNLAEDGLGRLARKIFVGHGARQHHLVGRIKRSRGITGDQGQPCHREEFGIDALDRLAGGLRAHMHGCRTVHDTRAVHRVVGLEIIQYGPRNMVRRIGKAAVLRPANFGGIEPVDVRQPALVGRLEAEEQAQGNEDGNTERQADQVEQGVERMAREGAVEGGKGRAQHHITCDTEATSWPSRISTWRDAWSAWLCE